MYTIWMEEDMSTQTSSPQNPNKINKYENIQGHTSEYFFSVLELIQTVIKHSTEDEISALAWICVASCSLKPISWWTLPEQSNLIFTIPHTAACLIIV